ncbi:MAG: D-alanine--D-alanine ligase [Candidatus Melainabacteria bacterium]
MAGTTILKHGNPPPALTKTTRIAVLYGGMSSERDVSLRSGKNCFEALKRLGFEHVTLIDVDNHIAEQLLGNHIEVVYNALHGRYGEDGCIQGLLEILGIPYTGNGVAASALTMDKALTKTVLAQAGLPVLPSITVDMTDKAGALCRVAGLTYPLIVKPLNEGSSIGMSKVDEPARLQKALADASAYSNHVMVEEFRAGQSITVGVVDVDGQPTVTPILEMRPVEAEWYDFEAKYTPGATQFIIPAEIPEEVTRAIQETTLQAHAACGCHGVSRTDYIVDADRNFYILEINTLPGMTDQSDLPAQAKAMGIGYDQLTELLLKTALTPRR